jgi:predicted DNA-binding transcriptional regulator YafY
MNLFEKIFNFQLLSRLEDTGTFTVTAQERIWLKMMLESAAADNAFDASTRGKLLAALEGEAAYALDEELAEKAASLDKPLFPVQLQKLRHIIRSKSAVRLTYRIKEGRVHTDESGFPYKLEYNMVKREWYLLWYHRRYRALMCTRLLNVEAVEEVEILPSEAERIMADIGRKTDDLKEQAVIEVVRRYNGELSRILYAFSCLDKEVDYDEETDTYLVRLHFLANEREYVLSKLRFLGMRVRVTQGGHLKRRMLESASKALMRYGDGEEG